MEQPVLLVVEATPDLEYIDAYRSYTDQATSIARAHGGIPVAKYDVEAVLDGGAGPAIFTVISFPDRSAIKALFSHPAYKALIPDRDLGFSRIRHYVVNEKV